MLHVSWVALASLGQSFGVGSSVIGFLWGLSSFTALLLQHVLSLGTVYAYAAGQFIPSMLGVEITLSLIDIFVPLVSVVLFSLVDTWSHCYNALLIRQDAWGRQVLIRI